MDPAPGTTGSGEPPTREPEERTHLPDEYSPDPTTGTTGGGGPRTAEREPRIATEPPSLHEIGFTFWVDGQVLHVLADPLDTDDEDGPPRYEWIWGDGETTLGGPYESHRYIDAVEQTLVTLVRLDPDGMPTHETTEWIDLTFYQYGPGPSDSQAQPTRAAHVLTLDREDPAVRADPGVQSDLGALVASTPLPPMTPLLGLILVAHQIRKKQAD